MNREHDEFTHVIEAWLDATEAQEDPGAVFDHVIGQLDATPQRRSSWLAWRSPVMSNPVRIALAATAVIVVGVVAVNLRSATPQLGGGPSPSSSATPGTDLGVFEPARGRVVFRVGPQLEAVDPDDPSSRVVIEPGSLGLSFWPMPAGWSADGSKLAITDEYNGDLYVMDRTGSLDRVGERAGCCWFVTEAWMSPDGTKRVVFDSGRLQIVDLEDSRPSRVIDVEQFEETRGDVGGQPSMPVWSPDGSQVAYIWSKGGDFATPAVGIVDLTSGASRELISGWGLVRQLAWSPDGSQLLAVAGPNAPGYNRQLNPLVHSQVASLYLVDIDDGEAHEVASGHYVAAAWSPDGTRIAAIDYDGGHRVVVVSADGSGGPQVLAELFGDDDLFTGVVWHPVPVR